MSTKRSLQVLLLALLMAVTAVTTPLAAAADAGDFGVYPASPEAPTVHAVWYYITGYRGYEKHDTAFEIRITVKEEDMSLFLSFPSLGGVRLENEAPAAHPESFEKTGVFEPESNQRIDYQTVEGQGIDMTGTDGTRVRFSETDGSWKLTVYDAAGVRLFDITPGQISFGLSQKKWAKTRLELPLSKEEVVYGTGERFGPVNQNGTRTVMWNSDAAYHSAASTGNAESIPSPTEQSRGTTPPP